MDCQIVGTRHADDASDKIAVNRRFHSKIARYNRCGNFRYNGLSYVGKSMVDGSMRCLYSRLGGYGVLQLSTAQLPTIGIVVSD